MTDAPEAVFLDRDGTIIEDVRYISSPDDVRLIPGAADAIRRINGAGALAIVVTNQSGIARGLSTVEDYEAVRARFEGLLEASGARIDASYYCPHHPAFGGPCECRKPGTLLFERALRDFDLRPERVAYVGDRWRDVAAAKKLGGRAVLIGSSMTTAEDRDRARDDGVVAAATLGDAVEHLFGLTESRRAK